MKKIQIDLEAAARYLLDSFERGDRLAVFLRKADTGRIEQRTTALETITQPKYLGWLGHQNRDGYDVYASMNTVRPGAWTRTRDDIQDIRHLYVDIDHGGQAAINRIMVSDKVPSPTHVLNTSPGKYQAIWRVNGLEKDDAERYLRGLVAEFGTDPAATDVSRVLRVPGYQNNKYPEHPIVRAHRHSHEAYAASAFDVKLDLKPERAAPQRLPQEHDFQILQHVDREHLRQVGRNYETQCPSCAKGGRDSRHDNLHIKIDDSRFYICRAGCTKEDIRAAVGRPFQWHRVDGRSFQHAHAQPEYAR